MIFYFFLSLVVSIIFTVIVSKIASKYNIIDIPDGDRKKHRRKVPLLGGVAIFLSFWLVVGYSFFFTDLIAKNIQPTQLLWALVGSLLLILFGIFDDIKSISPLLRLIVSSLAVILVMMGGVGLISITNPLGGIIGLDFWQINFSGLGNFLVAADLLVFFWLMGMTHTTKILDGLDGLSTGVVAIGAMMIFFLTSTTKFFQPDVRLIALILAGVCVGFLIFNFFPAKIFLGESGGLFLGFILGVLAIIAGGKIATALLVMAVPIMDLILVIWQRFKAGQPIFKGDRRHLHFRLVDRGFTQRQSVLFLYLVAFLFGVTTLILPSLYKMITLLILIVLFIILEKKLCPSNPATNG